jgi:small-conductance mechanosensitive channel/CRP-like cAMP-binding protein
MPPTPPSTSLRTLKGPIGLLLLLAIPMGWFWDDLFQKEAIAQTFQVLKLTLLVALWISVAWLIVRLTDVFIWEGIVAKRLNGKVPKLLKDVIAMLIFLVSITGILSVIFDLDVTGLWATSGVIGLVVGLALQSMISDVFSGIALNVDRPFVMGDWVTFHQRGLDNLTGQIQEVNWRSTRIKKVDGTLLVIPNGMVSTTILTNLSQPSTKSRFTLRFCLEVGVPSDRAVRILLAGVKAASGPLASPAPKARIGKIHKWGVEYDVRFWLETMECSPHKGRHNVSRSILDHLHRAGLTIAYEKQDLYVAPMPPRQLDVHTDRLALLRRVVLFEHLEEPELKLMAEHIQQQFVKVGEEVVTRGDRGDSLFLLVEGLLAVFAPTEEGSDVLVGRLTPGQFFGEMSLLTGEPRSASIRTETDCVLYEITKESLTRVLERRPELAEEITHIVAERKIRTAKSLKDQSLKPEEHREETLSLATQLLSKMRSLFSLG